MKKLLLSLLLLASASSNNATSTLNTAKEFISTKVLWAASSMQSGASAGIGIVKENKGKSIAVVAFLALGYVAYRWYYASFRNWFVNKYHAKPKENELLSFRDKVWSITGFLTGLLMMMMISIGNERDLREKLQKVINEQKEKIELYKQASSTN